MWRSVKNPGGGHFENCPPPNPPGKLLARQACGLALRGWVLDLLNGLSAACGAF